MKFSEVKSRLKTSWVVYPYMQYGDISCSPELQSLMPFQFFTKEIFGEGRSKEEAIKLAKYNNKQSWEQSIKMLDNRNLDNRQTFIGKLFNRKKREQFKALENVIQNLNNTDISDFVIGAYELKYDDSHFDHVDKIMNIGDFIYLVNKPKSRSGKHVESVSKLTVTGVEIINDMLCYIINNQRATPVYVTDYGLTIGHDDYNAFYTLEEVSHNIINSKK